MLSWAVAYPYYAMPVRVELVHKKSFKHGVFLQQSSMAYWTLKSVQTFAVSLCCELQS